MLDRIVSGICRFVGSHTPLSPIFIGTLLRDMYVAGVLLEYMRVGDPSTVPEQDPGQRLIRVARNEINHFEFTLHGVKITWCRNETGRQEVEIWADTLHLYSTRQYGGWAPRIKKTFIPFLLHSRLMEIRDHTPSAEADIRRHKKEQSVGRAENQASQIRELEERLITPLT